MGSSKTGSLDKFAKFSPAAALGSGKVKLPETGLIGMMQQNQEDKMAFNAANIAAQQQAGQQKAQYNQMLQQMRSRMAPTPFANGGNVTLRRKMFKLGGSASAHGTGLTSGLEFNQGGAVVKPGPDGQPRQNVAIGGILKALIGRAAIPAFQAAKRGSTTPLKRFIAQGTKGKTGAAREMAKRLRQAELAALGVAGPVGAVGVPAALLPDAGEDSPPLISLAQDIAEGTLDLSPIGLGYMAGDKLFSRPSEYDFETLTGKSSIFGDDESVAETLGDDDSVQIGMTPDELSELANQQQRENLEEAMAMYQDLIRGEDNTNKLMTLGDAAIAAGSALMEGEGYGGAATAFNEPLSQARAQQQALDTESRAAAAQLAIGEDITSRQLQVAQRAELLATGMFDTEEEINSILLGRQFGIARTIPEDDKGEIDNDAVKQAGAGVYVDPKQRFGGLFISVNSDNQDLITNDPEQAKQHAKS